MGGRRGCGLAGREVVSIAGVNLWQWIDFLDDISACGTGNDLVWKAFQRCSA